MDSSIVTRAPFVPIGFLTTWTSTSWPGFSSSSIFFFRRLDVSMPGNTTSSTWRKPFLGRPRSMNAASMPRRTLSTLAL